MSNADESAFDMEAGEGKGAAVRASPSVYCLHADDLPKLDQRLSIVGPLIDYVGIGVDLYIEQPGSVGVVNAKGLKCYAHFLYYDVREVVSQAACRLVHAGFAALDLHSLCGRETISATREAVQAEARALGREAPLVIACTLLPTQMDLPWAPQESTLDDARGFALKRAEDSLDAGADGVLMPYEVADKVLPTIPEGKVALVYANPEEQDKQVSDQGTFYDWHLHEFWAQEEGISVIRSRRPGYG